MNVSDLKNFKTPLPARGTYELLIKEGRDITGKEDANGETSTGLALKYVIKGPKFATMTDGSSAVGYEFDETVWLPKPTLEKTNPKAASGMKKRMMNRIIAAFGENFPEEIPGSAFSGKEVKADLYTKFDSYTNDEIAIVDHLETMVPF